MIGRPGSVRRYATFLAGTFIAAIVVEQCRRLFHLPPWSFYAISLGAGIILFFAAHAITFAYIKRRVGFDADWESTAGTGVVPRWVSFVGLCGLWLVLAAPFRLIGQLFT